MRFLRFFLTSFGLRFKSVELFCIRNLKSRDGLDSARLQEGQRSRRAGATYKRNNICSNVSLSHDVPPVFGPPAQLTPSARLSFVKSPVYLTTSNAQTLQKQRKKSTERLSLPFQYAFATLRFQVHSSSVAFQHLSTTSFSSVLIALDST